MSRGNILKPHQQEITHETLYDAENNARRSDKGRPPYFRITFSCIMSDRLPRF